MDPCLVSKLSISEPNLANHEEHKDQIWPSENRDPSPHGKDPVCKVSTPELTKQDRSDMVYDDWERSMLELDFFIWVPNASKNSFEENVANLKKYKKLFNKYQKQVRAYEGFYVDVNAYKKCSGSGLITPVAEVNELVNKIVTFAIEEYNKSQGKDLKLERTVRANEKFMGAGFMFYLTLEANDKCFYEAKVYRKASNGDNTLKFFRRAKYYPKASSKKKKKSTEPKLAEL